MKHFFIALAIVALPFWVSAQEIPTAVLKINTIEVDLNGEKVDWDKTFEVTLTDGIMSPVIVFEQDGIKFGTEFTYKKGRNRIKLVRRCYALKAGTETQFSKKKKDMQEIKTSIPGSLNKRVVENILLSRENLESINVSFKYELIYK